MRPIFKSPHKIATSVVVECSFNELKNKILRFDVKPMTVDRFVVSHLKSIESDAKLFSSKQQRNEFSKKILDAQSYQSIKRIKQLESSSSETDNSINSIDAYENWGNKGNYDQVTIPYKSKTHYKKPRLSKYMSAVPDIDRILLNRTTRSSNNKLLVNGNMATPLLISKKRFLLQNTCPFDSISVLIAMAYIDNDKYKNDIDKRTNDLLQFCKSLAIEPVSKATYKFRLSLLQTIFPEDTGITDVKLINARFNVNYMATSFLTNSPFAEEYWLCSNETCLASKTLPSPTIVLRLQQKNFSMLEQSLKTYITSVSSDCINTNCKGVLKISKILQDHSFIETDCYVETNEYMLMDFPVNLNINNKCYLLNGRVAYGYDHYVTYVLRVYGWEVHNDLVKKIKRSPQTTVTKPHLIIYTQQ